MIPVSFTATCQRLNVEPWRYLRHVLERLPSHPPELLAEFLPDEWARAQRRTLTGTPPGARPREPLPRQAKAGVVFASAVREAWALVSAFALPSLIVEPLGV
jgi:hypothetical protein